MAFIGNTNTTQAFTPAVDYFSGNGSTTAFTLSRSVASVAQIQAVIENVPQNPGSAYTVSGNTITFTSAPPSGTNNIYVYYTSPINQVIAPGQGTVGPTQLSASGTASSSTYLRGDNTWATISAGGATGVAAQLFTSSGTFTVPSGVTSVKVTVIGGGGGGGAVYSSSGPIGTGGGGGGGGVAVKWVTGLTAGDTVTVTVGAAGTGTTGSGSAGGTSSFGAHCSATGGSGGNYGTNTNASGGAGGAGSSGTLNYTGGAGTGGGSYNPGYGYVYVGGNGGASGGAVTWNSYQGAQGFMTGYAANYVGGMSAGNSASGYGNGGGGACAYGGYGWRNGGNGTAGAVLVEW